MRMPPIIRLTASALATAILLAGCSGMAGRGPSALRVRNGGEYHLVSIEREDTIPPPVSRPRSTMPRSSNPRARYTHEVEVRDQLEVMITDASNNSPFGRAFTYGPVEVSEDGQIMVPYIGAVHVVGRAVPDVSQELTDRAQKVSHSAQVALRRTARLPKRAFVMGEVHTPGPVPIDRENFNILDLISCTGGTLKPSFVYSYSLQRRNEICQFSEEDIRRAPFLIEDGDVLRIDPDRSRIFHAAGSVVRPGLYDFPSEQPTLLEAISQAGGLNGVNSDPYGVFVFREDPQQGQVAYALNFKNPNSTYLAKKFPLQGGDFVYVSEAPISEWSSFVNGVIPAGPMGYSMARTVAP